MVNGSNVESAARSALRPLIKTTGADHLTEKQVKAIVKAIMNAIEAYDQISRY